MLKKCLNVALLFLLIFSPDLSHAQNEVTFAYRYNNGYIGNRIRQLPDESYVVVGGEDGYAHDRYEIWEGADWKRNADIFLMKVNEYSEVVWQRTYGTDSTREHGMWLEIDNAGNFIIAGCRTYENSIGALAFLDSSDVVLMKVNPDGELLWSKVFDTGGDDWAYNVIQTQDGGYLVSCFTDSLPVSLIGNTSIMLIKTDINGNLEWEKKYQYAIRDFDIGKAFTYVTKQTRDKGFITVGTTFNTHQADLYVMRLDSSANVVWAKSYDHVGPQNNFSGAYDVIETFDNSFVVAGFMDLNRSSGNPSNLNYAYALHLDDTGKVIRPQYFDYFSFRDKSGFSSVYQKADSSIIFCGKAGYGVSGEELVMAKTDDSLNLEWGRHYSFGGPMLGGSRDIRPAADGGYILSGIMSFNGVALLKTDAQGQIACHADAPVTDTIPLITTVYWSPDTISGISELIWSPVTDTVTEDTTANCFVQIPLPVSIMSFSVTSENSHSALLEWETASGSEVAYFEIERSLNGEQFEKIEEVNSNINGRSGHYNYQDNNISGPKYFYRLKMNDWNGNSNYSEIKKIEFPDGGVSGFTAIFEKDRLDLIINSEENQEITFILTDINGKICFRQAIYVTEGKNSFFFEHDFLSDGVYIVRAGTIGSMGPSKKIVKISH